MRRLVAVAVIAIAVGAGARPGGGTVLDATVQGSCAPWDGAAFAVSMPVDSLDAALRGATLAISIWKAPDLPASTFTFLEAAGGYRDSGAAVLQTKGDKYQRLTGTVSFTQVRTDAPVDGSFDLVTQDARRLSARFHATWKHERVICG